MINKFFKKSYIIPLAILAFTLLAGSLCLVLAKTITPVKPLFVMPVNCTMNKDCWITQYPDEDPTSRWHDYTGGRRTSNKHTGTDIALSTIKAMNDGVSVVAAMDGTVVGIRDGMADINVKNTDLESVDGVECGNRVAINHGDGWLTDYCHLKKGSLTVKKGDKVTANQKIGEVGLSGFTEMPHLHFQAMHYKDVIDPFTAEPLLYPATPLKKDFKTLWSKPALKAFKYYPVLIYNIGISDTQPDSDKIKGGEFSKSVKINTETPFIYLWSDNLAVEKDDIIKFVIKDPSAKTLMNRQFFVDKSNVRRFVFARLSNTQPLEPGTYTAEVKVTRPPINFSYMKTLKFEVDSNPASKP